MNIFWRGKIWPAFGGFGGSDRDFTDFVVIVESVNPIPEPGILALLGLGLLGMAGGRRFTKA
ncbi:MAG: PEP-CTERM sorting domain-containing protein [Nitrosomonas sp.]|nr:PEP-CTERM sorting domain-containing protein [Nitrosomonas sp.]